MRVGLRIANVANSCRSLDRRQEGIHYANPTTGGFKGVRRNIVGGMAFCWNGVTDAGKGQCNVVAGSYGGGNVVGQAMGLPWARAPTAAETGLIRNGLAAVWTTDEAEADSATILN